MATNDQKIDVVIEVLDKLSICITTLAMHRTGMDGVLAFCRDIRAELESLKPDDLPATKEIDLCGKCHERPCRCPKETGHQWANSAFRGETFCVHCSATYSDAVRFSPCSAAKQPYEPPKPAKCEHNKHRFNGGNPYHDWFIFECDDCYAIGRAKHKWASGDEIQWWPVVKDCLTTDQNDVAVKALRELSFDLYLGGFGNRILEVIDAKIRKIRGAG